MTVEKPKKKTPNKAKSIDGVVRVKEKPEKNELDRSLERLHFIDNSVDKLSEFIEKAKKKLKGVRISKKQLAIGTMAVLALFVVNVLTSNSPVEEAPAPQVAAAADNPVDQRRTNDLKRLKTAIELYFENSGELPSREIVSSQVFKTDYLGEFDYPGDGSYEIGVYSTAPYIIGYALNTVCNTEGNGTTPSEIENSFTLHVILDTIEGNQFYCVDATS